MYFLPNVGKGGSSVDILPVDHLGYVQLDQGLAMDESVHDVLLQSRQVIPNLLRLAMSKGVLTMRENNGEELVLIVQQVTSLNMAYGNLAVWYFHPVLKEKQANKVMIQWKQPLYLLPFAFHLLLSGHFDFTFLNEAVVSTHQEIH